MSQFLDQARHLWEVAGATAQAGAPDSTHTILIHPENGVHIVSDSDWALASLQSVHGAPIAYRVTCAQGRIRVEGRAGTQSCVLEDTPKGMPRRYLVDWPVYSISSPTLPLTA